MTVAALRSVRILLTSRRTKKPREWALKRKTYMIAGASWLHSRVFASERKLAETALRMIESTIGENEWLSTYWPFNRWITFTISSECRIRIKVQKCARVHGKIGKITWKITIEFRSCRKCFRKSQDLIYFWRVTMRRSICWCSCSSSRSFSDSRRNT